MPRTPAPGSRSGNPEEGRSGSHPLEAANTARSASWQGLAAPLQAESASCAGEVTKSNRLSLVVYAQKGRCHIHEEGHRGPPGKGLGSESPGFLVPGHGH